LINYLNYLIHQHVIYHKI